MSAELSSEIIEDLHSMTPGAIDIAVLSLREQGANRLADLIEAWRASGESGSETE